MAHEGHDDHHHHHHHAIEHHRSEAPASVAVAIVTVSDSRTTQDDVSGKLAVASVEKAGHSVVARQLVKDDREAIAAAVDVCIEAGARAVVLTGGTGLSSRDVTIETIRPRLEKELDGFGELFRALSFQKIGPAAMASRATAGLYRRALVFALPGSPQAVELALSALILPELGHLVRQALR